MNPLKKLLLLACAALTLCSAALADTYVRGYTKRNGTYVSGHYRSDPNGTVRDNWSYYGNTNPYTGSVGTNRYYNSPTSEYYRGSSYSTPSRGSYSGYDSYSYPNGYYSAPTYPAPVYQSRTYYHEKTKSSYYYPRR